MTVLEGLRLSQAVEFRPKETNRGVLLTEIEELELAKDKLIKQKQTYVSKLNILKYFFIISTTHFISFTLNLFSSLKNIENGLKLSKLGDLKDENKEENDMKSVQYCNSLLNQDFDRLERISTRIQTFLGEEKLLFRQSFANYLSMEDECTVYLTDYAATKFDQVIISIFIL